jgi:hypothetical protein
MLCEFPISPPTPLSQAGEMWLVIRWRDFRAKKTVVRP